MDQYIKGLWSKNKFFFFLLLPVLALYLLRDVIFGMIIGDARKVAKEAKKKDDKLQNEQQAAEQAANQAKSEADEIGKEADNVDADEDWHKGDL